MISILQWLVFSSECVVTVVLHLALDLPILVIKNHTFKIARAGILAVNCEIHQLSCLVPILHSFPVDLDLTRISWIVDSDTEGAAWNSHSPVVNPDHLLLSLPGRVCAHKDPLGFLLQKWPVHLQVLVASFSFRLCSRHSPGHDGRCVRHIVC